MAEPFAAAAPSESERTDAPRWSLATRVAFRFFFCFLGLAYLPFPLTEVPGWDMVGHRMWAAIAGAIGPSVLGRTFDTEFTGSGDMTVHWVRLGIQLAFALAATLIWSILDRRATSYPRLYAWFRVYIRFALAIVMIGYGAFKVIPSQFMAPVLDRLVQPFGDASPMGLLWTFMGASVPYQIFTGIGEMIGGLLLTVRRTTLLGALITAAVMTHVAMLNFAYDVPVKIFSSLLLLTALVIAAPDARRLYELFFQSPDTPIVKRRGWRIAARVAIAAFVLFCTGKTLNESWQSWKATSEMRSSTAPFYGIWNVDELTIDGVARPPLTTDASRWRRLVVSGREWGSFYRMDDSRTRFFIKVNAKNRTLQITRASHPKIDAKFTYTQPDRNTLVLDGTFDGKRTVAKLRKTRTDKPFLLESRGFHWVNETPFNR